MKTKNTGIAMEMFTESACTFCTYIYSNLALDLKKKLLQSTVHVLTASSSFRKQL